MMDTSSVFHVAMLDDEHRIKFDLPWLFETADGIETFATGREACAAQRAYREQRGFDPFTGERVEIGC